MNISAGIQYINRKLLFLIYIYLCLPVLIFILGWCKWYISIPISCIIVLSFFLSLKEHHNTMSGLSCTIAYDWFKLLLAIGIIMVWVLLSGIGGYTWQNSDHWWRNAIFDILVTEEWPVKNTVLLNGSLQEQGLIYYIGFWMLPALIGKIFGLSAGYAAQYFWAVLGICLLYSIICTWRKKIVLWPLFILIFFSGADIIGSLITADTPVHLFGTEHLERWPGSYQFSSMTTQLFWVFNQAIPAWLVCALIFLYEKPRNMIYIWSLIILTSTFPFIGLSPYIIYFMICRSPWKCTSTVPNLLKSLWKNWASVQNIIGGGFIMSLSMMYLLGNISGNMQQITSLINAQSIAFLLMCLIISFLLLCTIIHFVLLGYQKYIVCIFISCFILLSISLSTYYMSTNQLSDILYKILVFITFYSLEIGVYFLLIIIKIPNRILLCITSIWLLAIPLIKVGSSIDFCMRASIPALFLVILWCIDIVGEKRKTCVTYALIALLLLGSITSFHEIIRTLVNTSTPYKLERIEKEEIFCSDNFSGSSYGFFWRYISK